MVALYTTCTRWAFQENWLWEDRHVGGNFIRRQGAALGIILRLIPFEVAAWIVANMRHLWPRQSQTCKLGVGGVYNDAEFT